MRTLLRWSGRLLAFLVVLLLLAGTAGMGLVWTSLPPAQEELDLPGLSAPVEVTLDQYGIPRITAETERDANMALGYLHARDRMFQMESMRRGAQGRLAEIAGPAALRLDRLSRTLGLAQRAQADLAILPPETRDALEAYAEGVNAWIAVRGKLAAPEFLVLGEPEPWRPEHSLLWGKVMGLWLSGAWQRDIARARLAQVLSPEKLADLWPEDESQGRADLPPTASAALDAGHAERLLAAVPPFPAEAPLPESASNAWALTPSRSATGAALLANDPHLGFQAPILWYLARIQLPGGRFLAGATSPGVPFMVIGRNESLAWGFTTTHSDVQDVFVERLASPQAYLTPDGPRPFTLRDELIRVRGAEEPERLRVRESRHGPIVSDLDPSPPNDGTVVAVAMANLAPEDTAAAGLQALNRARSVAEARSAAALITSPPQNLMLADAEGQIAMVLTGRVPLRRAGDGSRPVPGWDGSADWLGWLPFDALPHVEAPESGLLVNANNRVSPQGHPAFLGRDWFGDWRFRRIGELLARRPKHTPEELAEMQMDTVSLQAREALPFLRTLPRPEGAAGVALDLLRESGWAGEMTSSRPQPLIFNAWIRAFGRAALLAGGVPDAVAQPSPEFLRLLLRNPERTATTWCGGVEGGCAGLAARALTEAVTELSAIHGADPTAWRWGAAHVARFEHPLLRFLPGLGAMARLTAETGGDGETVFRGGFRGGDGGAAEAFAHVHGAGLRIVMDLSGPDGIRAMIATGQSGHPLSDHWGNLLQPWRDGRVDTLGEQPAQVTGRLRMRPAPSP
jgi:penicillin amidase